VSESVDTLLSRVDRALKDHAHADQTTRTVEHLTNLEKQLTPYIEDLDQAVAASSALDQVRRPMERPETQALAAACRHSAELVRQNKLEPPDLPRILRQINDLLKTANATARDAWHEFIDTSMPGLDSLKNLTEMLSQMGADKLQVANLRRGVSDLRALSRNLPDASAPSRAYAAVDVIYPALTVLLGDSDTDSEEVRYFIDAVARGGAQVDALTPAVKHWMHHSGVENSFKIVAGRPTSE
jgi:hypothetical protein